MSTSESINQYNRVMLDLETLGTRPGCAILSVGAVFFSSTLPQWKGPTFYSAIAAGSGQGSGLHEDPDTLAWWGRQKPEARKVWEEIKVAPVMTRVLEQFSDYVLSNAADPRTVQVWGNGADFDNPILSAAYKAITMPQPWGAFHGRCYRTLKSLNTGVRLVRSGTHHNALDDALSQAEHACRLLNMIRSVRKSVTPLTEIAGE